MTDDYRLLIRKKGRLRCYVLVYKFQSVVHDTPGECPEEAGVECRDWFRWYAYGYRSFKFFGSHVRAYKKAVKLLARKGRQQARREAREAPVVLPVRMGIPVDPDEPQEAQEEDHYSCMW